ncbi:glycoside hydrolase family 99-like domain-containing protein [Flavobacterium sp.]|uniref:glycoside hydrolase family 99-like domain-containing protein n=1 Tax=Flavobacterium sp. TaxID=239 RepID=UPI00286EA428|nr:glycoside hydrolase family 99-like domain-containing protein [Flavobacterium sp.]
MKNTLILYAFCLVFCFGFQSNIAQKTKQKKTKYDVAAFYWPAYHPDSRFKDIGVFPDGKGEWEAIYKAKPKFVGHEVPKVPLWGYEDESDPVVMAKKIKKAVKHGVNVMIFDWYWYDNKPFLEETLNKGFLKAKNSTDMRFYLMWANHDHGSYLDPANPDKSKIYWRGGVSREIFEGMIDHIINDYFKKPNYYKINGEPVISIYELSTFMKGIGGAEKAKEALDYFTKKTIEAGFPGLHLQAILWGNIPKGLKDVPGDKVQTQSATVEYFGFKSMTNYQWCHIVKPTGEYTLWGEKAIKKWDEWDTTFKIPYCPQVSIGWDCNPRYPVENKSLVVNTKPEYFKTFLQKAKEYVDKHPNQPRLITINAWNEWAEGSYLEPDEKHGYDNLKAVKSVFIDGK